MFSRSSPLKRKHSEFHDPDYPQQEENIREDDGSPGCSNQFSNKIKSFKEIKEENATKSDNYFDKVRRIIDREFQREIEMKQQQLEEIDIRLEKAKHLLERLRYGIVSAYYKKQEIPLTAADAVTLKGTYTLFDRDDKGPQMPIHPSVKKLIGKRPKDLSEVIRSCPKRTAAKNAVQTIRAKSQAQKREERKLKQIIKQQGIVIDHSKQNVAEGDVNSLLNAAAQNTLKSTNTPVVVKQEKVFKVPSDKTSGKSLNAARLNNKIKHLIVVGNTSKYIGNEIEGDIKPNIQALTHKWLVYVQPKDTKLPIERFIKKVRFHLHRSYRPNDVVDIESPPFQISRRGWGEFPIRVQLFFHSEFHQKPVQLIHNIVLDQTMSGIQTLGAETLLEIWLRDVKSTGSIGKEIEDKKPEIEYTKKPNTTTTPNPNIISRSEELLDDNLLDFLNKIEASPCSISADIEKIQPTVLVNEPFGVKIKTPSPMICKQLVTVQQKPPTKILNIEERLKRLENPLEDTLNTKNNSTAVAPQPSTSVPIISHEKTAIVNNGATSASPKPSISPLTSKLSASPVKFVNAAKSVGSQSSEILPAKQIATSSAQTITPNRSLPITAQRPSVILNKDGKILMPSASVASVVHKTILPILSCNATNTSTSTTNVQQFSVANKTQVVSTPSSVAPIVGSGPKQILQKKLVQLVDSTGKIKYIQMLVAASSASSTVQNLNKSSVAPKLITMAPSLGKISQVTNTSQITNTVTAPMLRTPNGVTLMPAMTTKPNIFKIVPESMQTKPQIVTFNTTTAGTTFTNTVTTTNSLQQLQNLSTTAPQTAKPSTPSTTTATVGNKLQKSSISNAMNPTKNLVFQKEGKVYIIDPQQMKYKQQQKKQVSLLKPQISLLKQQQQKPIATPPAAGHDHQSSSDTSKASSTIAVAPPIHFGLKQQRINSFNALQLMQMKRMLFEKQFLRQEFTNIRAAVEFLLRRLKLVVPRDSLVADFPFVSHTLQQFCSLTAFKQRACEWLRAKNVSRLLRSHKDLQRLNNSSTEIFWSTKEIATFARQLAYTPPIKSLPKASEQLKVGDINSKAFTDLVKSELKQEQDFHYVTLTEHYKLRNWVDKVWQTLNEYEHQADQFQMINIDDTDEQEGSKTDNVTAVSSHSSISHLTHSPLDTYLTTPAHLENQCQLVSDICKDFHVKLAYEELGTRIYHPAAQTVLAQCLHLFIEKLLRQTVALKQSKSSPTTSVSEPVCTLVPQDFAKVLAANSEFDFLTNNNFGSALPAAELETAVKQETP